MTDLEMTKLCAEEMGLNWEAEQKRIAARDGKWLNGYETPLYDPLHDDAQAMALVKQFDLNLQPDHEGWCVSDYTGDKVKTRNANLNRAIVECVAKIREAELTRTNGCPEWDY